MAGPEPVGRTAVSWGVAWCRGRPRAPLRWRRRLNTPPSRTGRSERRGSRPTSLKHDAMPGDARGGAVALFRYGRAWGWPAGRCTAEPPATQLTAALLRLMGEKFGGEHFVASDSW